MSDRVLQIFQDLLNKIQLNPADEAEILVPADERSEVEQAAEKLLQLGYKTAWREQTDGENMAKTGYLNVRVRRA